MRKLIPYRYHTYTDTLIAIGNAILIEHLREIDAEEILLQSTPAGFIIDYPDGELSGIQNPFIQIKDKADRKLSESLGPHQLWDKTIPKEDQSPFWWGTASVINTLASPDFNNDLYVDYTPELGRKLLNNEDVKIKGRSRSQLLYAQASKGTGKDQATTKQGNLDATPEQVLAHLGFLYSAAGYIQEGYTVVVVPRPSQEGSITLKDYKTLVKNLRLFYPKAKSGKRLPSKDQTLPFFSAMMYFDFVEKLFDFLPATADFLDLSFDGGVGRVIGSLDRMIYYKMGTSSAPYASDSLAIPSWLDRKSVVSNVKDLIRAMLSAHADPSLLYLPIRTFAESKPHFLIKFYRLYNPISEKKYLFTQDNLQYIMQKTNYNDLNCEAMLRFARAIRSRTIKKLYSDNNENPDYQLLTQLKSASLDSKRLINMLSEFISSYNLRNARLSSVGKDSEGQNLLYNDLQVIIQVIEKHGAEFVANTLLAQAMSKRGKQEEENQDLAAQNIEIEK
jgi:hypothetical protein